MIDSPCMGESGAAEFGISAQNEPASHRGQTGYWVQSGCCFFPARTPYHAIEQYRAAVAESRIGISHNLMCDGVRAATAAAQPGTALRTQQALEVLQDVLAWYEGETWADFETDAGIRRRVDLMGRIREVLATPAQLAVEETVHAQLQESSQEDAHE